MSPALLIDTSAVFAFQQFLKAHDYPVQSNIDYGALLAAVKSRYAPQPAFEPMFAFVAIDPEHEGQRKFTTFLDKKLGFLVDETDFRDAFVLPNRESSYQRLSTRVTYVAGLLAHKQPDLVVVTDAFDVYFPLVDYVQHRGGRVTLAFFRRGLEERWQRTGLFEGKSPIEFLDLSADSDAIIGTDLSLGHSEKGRTGLGRFKI